MDLELIILIFSAFITSSISAILGMGGGIILLGIMALIIPSGYMAIALHGIIQLMSNATRAYVFRNHLQKNILSNFILGSIIGVSLSIIALNLLTQYFEVKSANQIQIDTIKPLIGLFIIWNLFFKKYLKKLQLKSFKIAGLLGGLSSVFVGATGPLIAPFFLNNNLTKEKIIANKAACQMITHLSKIPLFIYFFNFNYMQEKAILIPLIIAVFMGTNFGKIVLSFIPEKMFQTLFKITLFIIAIKLLFENQ